MAAPASGRPQEGEQYTPRPMLVQMEQMTIDIEEKLRKTSDCFHEVERRISAIEADQRLKAARRKTPPRSPRKPLPPSVGIDDDRRDQVMTDADANAPHKELTRRTSGIISETRRVSFADLEVADVGDGLQPAADSECKAVPRMEVVQPYNDTIPFVEVARPYDDAITRVEVAQPYDDAIPRIEVVQPYDCNGKDYQTQTAKKCCQKGHDMEASDIFCNECGSRERQAKKCCQKGHDMEPSDVFCNECGSREQQAISEDYSPQNRLTTLPETLPSVALGPTRSQSSDYDDVASSMPDSLASCLSTESMGLMKFRKNVRKLTDMTREAPKDQLRRKTTDAFPVSPRDLPPRPDADQSIISLLSLTPAILHREMCATEISDDGEEYLSNSYTMALLLIDVSGFTKMSVKLGAELTRKHTSKFFEKIINCIRHHAGDVLKFLGDALLVAWPTDLDAPLAKRQRLAQAAASCAATVMRKLDGYVITDEIVLTLHGALTIGKAHTFDVGTQERREFLIGGEVLAELGNMESLATSGQLVMDKEFADLLPPKALGEDLGNGHIRLDLNAMPKFEASNHAAESLIVDYLAMQFQRLETISKDTYNSMLTQLRIAKRELRTHTTPACSDALREGVLDVLGEMRHVTTLFLALDALIPKLNSGDVSLVQKVFVVIIDTVKGNGGAIRQFVLDDKGCVAICAWGLPQCAHGPGPDAVRAVRCALEMLRPSSLEDAVSMHSILGGLTPGPHIGIAAGEVYVGMIGAPQRCEYAMVGPSVNLSARLMGKACPWKVLVEEVVHEKVRDAELGIEFNQHPAVQAKGYDRLVKVFEPDCTGLQQSQLMEDQVERWDEMEMFARLVGKVASVLADSPHGRAVDFQWFAMVRIVESLGICSEQETRSAIIVLKSYNFIRLTRGARRGFPSYAFTSQHLHKWVLSLNTTEDRGRIHKLYACWLQDRIATTEEETATYADVKAAEAKMKLLHKEVDKLHEYHCAQAKKAKGAMNLAAKATRKLQQASGKIQVLGRVMLQCCGVKTQTFKSKAADFGSQKLRQSACDAD